MDQIKIGKFIAECRKNKNLTQAQLAELLGITDRAVSKWETGRSLPDSSIMIKLCSALDISVNDLLCGEIVAVDKYKQETENKLIEMVRQKEENDKKFLMLEWVIGGLSLAVMMIPIFAAAYLPIEDWQRVILIFSGFIPAIVGFGVAMKIEQTAGYYECQHCHHKYVPTLKAMYRSMHMGRTRYMECPECHKKSWQKKVISKDPKK